MSDLLQLITMLAVPALPIALCGYLNRRDTRRAASLTTSQRL